METPILSITIPTLNRVELLKISVDVILEQIAPFGDQIEFIILNNASDDATAQWLNESFEGHTTVKFINYIERVDIGQSISRCIHAASGEYVWMFGDDDLPMPFAVGTVINLIKQSKYGIVYLNYITANKDLGNYREVAVSKLGISPFELTLDQLVQDVGRYLGFLSALVFKRKNWLDSIANYRESHYGFNFLGPMLAGNKTETCLYYCFPLVAMRVGAQKYVHKWALYNLVGLPNLLKDLADDKVITESTFTKIANNLSWLTIVKNLLMAKAFEYHRDHFFWGKALSYQTGFRRFSVQFIRYFVPSVLGQFLFRNFVGSKISTDVNDGIPVPSKEVH